MPPTPTQTPQYVWVTHGNTEQFAILKEPLEGKSEDDEVLIHWVTTDNDDHVPVSSVKMELDSRRRTGRRRGGNRGGCGRTNTTTSSSTGGGSGGGGGLKSSDQGQGQSQERQGHAAAPSSSSSSAAPSAAASGRDCQKQGNVEETKKRDATCLLDTIENQHQHQQQQQLKKTKNNKKRRVSVVVDVEYASVTSTSILGGETIKNEGPTTTAVCEKMMKVEKQEEDGCTTKSNTTMTTANVPAEKATRPAETTGDAMLAGKAQALAAAAAAAAAKPKSEATDTDRATPSTITTGPEDSNSSPLSQLLLPPSSSSPPPPPPLPSSSSSLKAVQEQQRKHEQHQEQPQPHEEIHRREQPPQLDTDDNGFNVHVRRVKPVSYNRDHDDLTQDEDLRSDDSSSTTAIAATSPLSLLPFKTERLSPPLVDEQQRTKTYYSIVPSKNHSQEGSSVCEALSDSNSKTISLSTYPKEMKLIKKSKKPRNPNFGTIDSLTRNIDVKERPRVMLAPGPESSLPSSSSSSNDIGAQPISFGKKFNRKPVDRGGAFNTLDISPSSHHATVAEQECSASVNRQNWYKMLALLNQRNAHGGQ